MLLSNMKFIKNKILFALVLYLLLSSNIFCQENPTHENTIQEYFKNNSSSLYYLGVKNYFLGHLFNSVFIDGNYEDNYTELLFFIPVDNTIGLCIQQYDLTNILDAFTFEYDAKEGRFIRTEEDENISYFIHRYDALKEITNIRFKIIPFDNIKFMFIGYDIDLE